MIISAGPRPGCGDPGLLDNGRRIGDVFSIRAVVFFRCFDDYDIEGSNFRVCQENGLWSGVQPTCKPFQGADSLCVCELTTLYPVTWAS